MGTSSKDVELLSRIMVLEKLVDKLLDRVTTLEARLKTTESATENLAKSLVANGNSGDVWDVPETENKETPQKDELNHIMNS